MDVHTDGRHASVHFVNYRQAARQYKVGSSPLFLQRKVAAIQHVPNGSAPARPPATVTYATLSRCVEPRTGRRSRARKPQRTTVARRGLVGPPRPPERARRRQRMIVRCVAPAVVWTMHETGVHSAGEKDGVHEGKTGLLTGIFPPLHACLLLFLEKENEGCVWRYSFT